MNLTQGEKIQIRQILQSSMWPTAERLANLIIDQIKEQPSLDETEWKTLQNVLTREGEVRGIRRLIQGMYEIAKET